MIGFDYRAPDTIDEVCAALDELGDEARVMAGGTALVLLMKQRLVRPEVVLSLKQLTELQEITHANGTVRIGAVMSHRRVENDPFIREHLPLLSETLRKVATPRVRNQATLGGNLAHADPNQDPPPSLLVLNAWVELRSSSGQRTVPLDEFFTDYYETAIQPGELLTRVAVPVPPTGTGTAFLKFLPRTADDYATVSAAAALRVEGGVCRDVRIAFGSAGPTPIRARAVEAAIEGQEPTEANLRAAAALATDEVDPLSDIRGSADYKRDMAAVFAYRAASLAVERCQSRSD